MLSTKLTCDYPKCGERVDVCMAINHVIGSQGWIRISVERRYVHGILEKEYRHICPKHVGEIEALLNLEALSTTFAERAVDNEGRSVV